MSVIKIRSPLGSPFKLALKERVKQFSNGKPMTGNTKLFGKTVIIVIISLILYFMPFYVSMGLTWYLMICILRGATMALAGFNIGHDAIHGSYSSIAWVNFLFGLSFDVCGVSSWYWYEKHNISHHSKTNTPDDDDLNAGKYLRLGPWQVWLPKHKHQYLYAPILYGFEHLHWSLWNDFKKYFTHMIGDRKITRKMKFYDHVVFWFGKVLFVTKAIVIPVVYLGWLKGVIGFFVMEYFTGLIISVVFQLAHAQNKSKFFVPDPSTGLIDLEWAVEQVMSTADFATDSKLISWLVGGLNFQTIHHLFPEVSHVHYKSIQKIVIDTCEDFGLTYNVYPTVKEAVADHFTFLKKMGEDPSLLN